MLLCLIDLAKSQPLRLDGLVISLLDIADSSEFTLPLTEMLLKCNRDLQYLSLSFKYNPSSETPPGDLDNRSLSSHSDTIQDLYLGVGFIDHGFSYFVSWPSALEDIRWQTKHCRKLKQLAVPMPDIAIEDAVAEHWPAAYLDALVRLPHLPSSSSPHCD